jgi:hypothetical protein
LPITRRRQLIRRAPAIFADYASHAHSWIYCRRCLRQIIFFRSEYFISISSPPAPITISSHHFHQPLAATPFSLYYAIFATITRHAAASAIDDIIGWLIFATLLFHCRRRVDAGFSAIIFAV